MSKEGCEQDTWPRSDRNRALGSDPGQVEAEVDSTEVD